MNEKSTNPVLYIITNNHFDQTWRRCWERPFIFRGQTFISYADLEEFYMLDNLDIARRHPDYKFEVECAYVLRKFLERNPARLEELRNLAREGRFAVTGGGEAIIDGNMVLGESLVRNYVDGLLWVEDAIGQAARLAVRNDAFGNPAQLPQILRGCGITWATGMSYTPARGLYWRGLDGSVILHRTLPAAAAGGGNTKYPPCAVCGGTGVAVQSVCPACRGRGIDGALRAWLPSEINEEALKEFQAGLVWMNPEELLPNEKIIAWAHENRENPSRPYDVRFALEEEMAAHLQPWLENVDRPADEDLHPGVELNPNNSGCLVTRIKTKQAVRRQEYALLAAETLSVMSALKGGEYPHQALKNIRHKQFFTMFHDAITATHVDAAYEELQDYWKSIDQDIDRVKIGALDRLVAPEEHTLSVINPIGCTSSQVVSLETGGHAPVQLQDDQGRVVPVASHKPLENGRSRVEFLASSIPGFGSRAYTIAAGGELAAPHRAISQDVIENSRFRVEAGPNGLQSIYDKNLDREILAAGEFLPAEFILEHDEGSPWATLSPDQRRTRLFPFTRMTGVETGPTCERMFFDIDVPREAGFSGRALRGRLTVTLVEGLDRVDFHFQTWWDGFNHRLRVAMPVPITGRHIYEVPYGMLERRPYEPWFSWAGANGDWPAINWAGVEGREASVALFNRGTPSYRIEPAQPQGTGEVILLSLLRSPAVPTYLHEPEFYTMTDYDGMRDMGHHEFTFAVCAYRGPFNKSSVVDDADAYNAGLLAVRGEAHLPSLPRVTSGPARISAVKWAEKGEALILRLVEYRGLGGEVIVSIPRMPAGVEKVNLLERNGQPVSYEDGALRVRLRPWEIATLRISI